MKVLMQRRVINKEVKADIEESLCWQMFQPQGFKGLGSI